MVADLWLVAVAIVEFEGRCCLSQKLGIARLRIESSILKFRVVKGFPCPISKCGGELWLMQA